MSWIRCSGSSLACAALGCERAGDVSQLCMGAVMGRSVRRKLCEAVAAEAVGFGVRLGMGGYTTTTVSSVAKKQCVMVSMACSLTICLRLTVRPVFPPTPALALFPGRYPQPPMTAPFPPSECIPRPPCWSAVSSCQRRLPHELGH